MGQTAHKFCLPWASLICKSLCFFILLADDLPGPLAHWASEMKSYLPGRKIYLSWLTRRHFFQTLSYTVIEQKPCVILGNWATVHYLALKESKQ